MSNLPSGTGKIWIAGVAQKIIEEFREMCKPQGDPPRRKKTWEVFEAIWNEWKAYKEIDSDGAILRGGKATPPHREALSDKEFLERFQAMRKKLRELREQIGGRNAREKPQLHARQK